MDETITTTETTSTEREPETTAEVEAAAAAASAEVAVVAAEAAVTLAEVQAAQVIAGAAQVVSEATSEIAEQTDRIELCLAMASELKGRTETMELQMLELNQAVSSIREKLDLIPVVVAEEVTQQETTEALEPAAVAVVLPAPVRRRKLL